MDFQPIIRRGFNNLLNFSGRDSKQQFLVFYLTIFVSLFVLSIFLFLEDTIAAVQALEAFKESQRDVDMSRWSIDAVIARNDATKEAREALEIPAIINGIKLAFLGLILPFALTVSAMVRRLHDAGRSAKWLLAVFAVGLMTYLLGLPLVVGCLALLKSDSSNNAYGPATIVMASKT